MNTATEVTQYMDCPFGILAICARPQGLTSIGFTQERTQIADGNPHTVLAVQQLQEYFAGQRQQFTLTLLQTGTVFQNRVWQQLKQIPFGHTCSYGDIARNLDNAKAVRAVGTANGRNPFTIVVPCHRVIGSDGSLTGYAWGVDIKAGLLALEQSHITLKVSM